MNDIRGGRVTSYMDEASWEILTRIDSLFTRTKRPQPCYPAMEWTLENNSAPSMRIAGCESSEYVSPTNEFIDK
jgi:hypothetical protein